MTLKLNERYPGRFGNPSADYPQGSFKNRTTPTAKDGSYLEKDWANDKEGFFQSLIAGAGIAPSGAVDKVGASQLYDALLEVIGDASPGRLLNTKVFTASGTYTPTAGTKFIRVRGCGGGGAGGSVSASGANNTAIGAGGGGSAGNFAEARYTTGFSGLAVTIGAGGTPGVNGGATSFGGLLTLLGGPSAPAVTISAGANNSGDNALQTSGPTGSGIAFGSSGQGGGVAIVPQPATICRSGHGGSTPYGAGGRSLAGQQPGVAGFGYGSGGSGACNSSFNNPAQVGGNGAPGILIIDEYE